MTQVSRDVLHRAVECSTCSEVFLAMPPDGPHTGPSLQRPPRTRDTIKARHVCSKGHGTYVYWTVPANRRITGPKGLIWPYVIEW